MKCFTKCINKFNNFIKLVLLWLELLIKKNLKQNISNNNFIKYLERALFQTQIPNASLNPSNNYKTSAFFVRNEKK
jgi:hypothetical protein